MFPSERTCSRDAGAHGAGAAAVMHVVDVERYRVDGPSVHVRARSVSEPSEAVVLAPLQ